MNMLLQFAIIGIFCHVNADGIQFRARNTQSSLVGSSSGGLTVMPDTYSYFCLGESLGTVPDAPATEQLCMGVSPGALSPVSGMDLQLKPLILSQLQDTDWKRLRLDASVNEVEQSAMIFLSSFPDLCFQHAGFKLTSKSKFVTLQTCNSNSNKQKWDIQGFTTDGTLRPWVPLPESQPQKHVTDDNRSKMCLAVARCVQQTTAVEPGASDDFAINVSGEYGTYGTDITENTYCMRSRADSVETELPIGGSYIKMFPCDDVATTNSAIDMVSFTRIDVYPTPSPTMTLNKEAVTEQPTTSTPTTSPTAVVTSAPPTSSPTVATDAPTTTPPTTTTEEPVTTPPTTTEAPTTASPTVSPTPGLTQSEFVDAVNGSTQVGNEEETNYWSWGWIPVVSLGTALVMTISLSLLFFDAPYVEHALVKANLGETSRALVTVVDPFVVTSIAHFMVLGAQMYLPNVQENFFNFSLLFSWTTMNVPGQGFATESSSGRRLADTDVIGLDRYAVHLGIEPRYLFSSFLLAFFVGMMIILGLLLMAWLFIFARDAYDLHVQHKQSRSRAKSTTEHGNIATDAELDVDVEANVEESGRIGANMGAAPAQDGSPFSAASNLATGAQDAAPARVTSQQILFERSRNMGERLSRFFGGVLLRTVYFTFYPTVLMTTYQFKYVARIESWDTHDIVFTILASILILAYVAWFVYAVRLTSAPQQDPSTVDKTDAQRAEFLFLHKDWKFERRQFWIIRVVKVVIKCLFIVLITTPTPIQPALLMALSLAYITALVALQPYPTVSMNRAAVGVELLYWPCLILLLVFGLNQQQFSSASWMGVLLIVFQCLLVLFVLVVVCIKWIPVIKHAVQSWDRFNGCCTSCCCGSKDTAQPSAEHINEDAEAEPVQPTLNQRHESTPPITPNGSPFQECCTGRKKQSPLNAFSSGGQKYEDFDDLAVM